MDIAETDRKSVRKGNPAVTGARPWDGRDPASAGLGMADPHGRAPLLGGSGVGHASSVRSFERASFGFWGFSRSTEVVSRQFSNRCEAIFDTDTKVLVS